MTDEKSNQADSARNWWQHMTGRGDGPADRAGLARLRRLAVDEAMTEEPVLRLFRWLGFKNPARLRRVAALACVLAHVREHRSGGFGHQIGRARFSDDERTAKLKPIRFRRLLAASTDEEIATSFRRAVTILGGEADVADVARIILNFEREPVRRRLIFDYYATGELEDTATTPSPSPQA